eukprot:1179865-Rhodomonas_salina.1
MAGLTTAGGAARPLGSNAAIGAEPNPQSVMQGMFVPAECPYTATGLSRACVAIDLAVVCLARGPGARLSPQSGIPTAYLRTVRCESRCRKC